MNTIDIRRRVSDLFSSPLRSEKGFLPVNTVAWAPYEYGLMLACGSSDGSISILSSTGESRWTTKKIADCHPVSDSHSF